MCEKTPAGDPSECDCFECVEARKRPAGQGGGECCCRSQPSEGGDALESWRSAFHEAYREVQLEVLKAQIKKDMSKTMEKTAALVVEALMSEVRENSRRSGFQKDLRAKIEKIIESAGD
jgi:hypothetical protein